MTEPYSSDAARTGADSIDPERDAKIDELLLAGLEHYFAGRFQEAINVWGRVLFLDRSHARARAYIERARSAQAERQRHSEELLHQGVAAIRRGDGGAARELLESAAAQSESPDAALAYLDRLERLAGAVAVTAGTRDAQAATGRPPRALMPPAGPGGNPRPVRVLPLVAVAVIVGAVVILAAASDLLKPLVDLPWGRPSAGAAVTVAPEPLAVPRAAEITIARVRALSASGHSRDALALLDRVPAGDPAFNEAEQLRADIQRKLLEAAALASPPAGPTARDARE